MDDIEAWLERVRSAAARTAVALAQLTENETDGLAVLHKLKFTEMAWHPIAEGRSLNIVEQINQTWTCLVSLRSLPFLFKRHPKAGGFRLNLGTESGTDIESVVPNVVAAETFAAVHPMNNRKLRKDEQKLVRECPNALHRYVFFGSPGFRHERQKQLERVNGVEVWAIEV